MAKYYREIITKFNIFGIFFNQALEHSRSLMSTQERPWALRSIQAHLGALMSMVPWRYGGLWCYCPMLTNGHQSSLMLLAPWHHAHEWPWLLISEHKCSWALFSAHEFSLMVLSAQVLNLRIYKKGWILEWSFCSILPIY